MVENDVKK